MKTKEEMQKKQNECHRRLYQDRRSWGKCGVCGKSLDDEKKAVCAKCSAAQAEYRQKNRERLRQKQRERVARYREQGLCVYCGNQIAEGSKFMCEKHKEYYNAKRRKQKSN